MGHNNSNRCFLVAAVVTTVLSVGSSVTAGEHQRSGVDPTRWYHWPTREITYYIEDVGDAGIEVGPDGPISREDLRAVAERAFSAWAAPCTDLTFSFGGYVADRSSNMTDYQINHRNTIIFRGDDWNGTEGGDGLAITLAATERGTGRIEDADIDINARDHAFALDVDAGELGVFDLQSVLTNQVGRLLGFDYSPDPTAAMWPYASGGAEGIRRNLAADDIAILCETYPSGECTTIDDAGQKECPIETNPSAAPPSTSSGPGREAAYPMGCSSVPHGRGSFLGALLVLATCIGRVSVRRTAPERSA